MQRIHLIIVAAVILAIVAGVGLLGTLSIPAPTQKIERTIPDDRLGK